MTMLFLVPPLRLYITLCPVGYTHIINTQYIINMVTRGLIFLQFFNTELVTAALQLLRNCFSVAERVQGAGEEKKNLHLGLK